MKELVPKKSDKFILFFHGCFSAHSKGKCYQKGRHVQKDIPTAISHYLKAIEQRDFGAYLPLGECYEEQKKMSLALQTYLKGALHNQENAKQKLQSLSDIGNVHASYCLGLVYEQENNWQAASELYREIATAQTIYTPYALDALVNMIPKYPKAAMHLAEMYLNGEANLKNTERVLEYYKMAHDLNDVDATFKLGQLYEDGFGNSSPDFKQAAKYYLTATKLKHEESLRYLENLLERINAPGFEYKLANFYYDNLKNSAKALNWYKKAADKNHKEASKKLYELARSHKNIAYKIAKMYEEQKDSYTQRFEKFKYYALAMLNNHMEAKELITTEAECGNPLAQYALGRDYYFNKQNVLKAAEWCIKAAKQNHLKACTYITNEVPKQKLNANLYLEIAKMCEEGIGISKNIKTAIDFYKKSSECGSAKAAIYLARLYQMKSDSEEKNEEEAFDWYLVAANRGDRTALPPLERLANNLDSSRKTQLSCTYNHLGDQNKAAFWMRKSTTFGFSNQRLIHIIEKNSLATCPK